MIVGENTCDGKKKSCETLKDLIPNLYVMDLPQMKSDEGKALLKAEYLRFKEAVEKLTGITIDAERLKKWNQCQWKRPLRQKTFPRFELTPITAWRM